MSKQPFVIATRESPLALCQAEWVKARLQSIHPELSITFLGITTQADKMIGTPLVNKGLFVKELEEALFDGRADVAVHSMKDVPMELPLGLCIPTICEREEGRDAFISHHYASLMELPPGAVVGTSSLRRQTQIRAMRPDITIQNLRGNINTRLNRLDQGDFTAIILAAAGLKRMDLTDRIAAYLTTEQCLPPAGQGALGIECRADNRSALELIAPLNHEITFALVRAERAVCRTLNGGCQVPVAAYAITCLEGLNLRGLVANRDGTTILRAELSGPMEEANQIGCQVAEALLQQGAADILKEFYHG